MTYKRLQSYFDEGRKVYRLAIGVAAGTAIDKQHPPPTLICEAVSRRYAQRIAAALNIYIPDNERRAIERQVMAKLNKDGDRVKKLLQAFRASGIPELKGDHK